MHVSQMSDPFNLPAAYRQMHSGFRWAVPEQFNMAQVCCTRWAQDPKTSKNIAVHAYGTGAEATFHTYFELQAEANRLSNVLAVLGVGRGDRVAIVMPQSFETAVAYMAVMQMGAVAMPLSMLFGPEALEFRLHDSEAVVALADASALAGVQAVRDNCPLLESVLGVGPMDATLGLADLNYAVALAQQPADFTPVATMAEEAAVLIYTSGTTGNPKGALIPHRALIGNLTGFVCSQNWFGFDSFDSAMGIAAHNAAGSATSARSDAVFWSPADWAWTGGLMDALLPTLYFGRPIVAFQGRFSPQAALELMAKFAVTHTFLFPTALKAMMKAYPGQPQHPVRQQFKLQLKAIMSAGEAVGDAVFDYCQQQLGVTVNEMFGQTEVNYIVGNCAPTHRTGVSPQPPEGANLAVGRAEGGAVPSLGWPAKPGSMGLGYPGHRVAVIDEAGAECPPDRVGEVALNRFDVHGQPDPIFFLGYWKNEAATRDKFTGDWCRTGDLARRDSEGYLWYQGRSDDVFKSAGYRIGPGEIENCLVKHPAVLNAAVVPKPDPARGALVKAYVVLAPEFAAARAMQTRAGGSFDLTLMGELQTHVKGMLAPYEYPKEIEFVDSLPMTTTGKVQRRVLRLQEEARAQEAQK